MRARKCHNILYLYANGRKLPKIKPPFVPSPVRQRMTPTSALSNADADLASVQALAPKLAAIKTEIGQRIFGQAEVIELVLTGMLAGGHVLLIGVPGVAKTRLVSTLGKVLGLDTRRIQCTPDLMPADILGSEILEESQSGARSFRFIPGPVFSQLLMADEINRASPRTQSALLQAMQEYSITVAGAPHALPSPFHVLATQNPIEQEGTYPLPEAQLDRFLLQVDVKYPDRAAERQMLLVTTGAHDPEPQQVFTPDELLQAQHLVRRLPVGDSVLEGILNLVRAGRPEESALKSVQQYVAWGPGPRAAQALMLGARARALLDGRLAPSLDDVLALAKPVLRHRMAVSFAARAEGISIDSIIDQLCQPLM